MYDRLKPYNNELMAVSSASIEGAGHRPYEAPATAGSPWKERGRRALKGCLDATRNGIVTALGALPIEGYRNKAMASCNQIQVNTKRNPEWTSGVFEGGDSTAPRWRVPNGEETVVVGPTEASALICRLDLFSHVDESFTITGPRYPRKARTGGIFIAGSSGKFLTVRNPATGEDHYIEVKDA